MPTEILAIGNTAADSADQVVGPGATLTVCLKSATGLADPSCIFIQLKSDSGQYFVVDRLTPFKPALMIMAAGTYRFSRAAGKESYGVFSG
jgi:hypothetical protein